MDPRELSSDYQEYLRELLKRTQSEIYTAFPVIVKKWNYPSTQKNTVELTIAIKGEEIGTDGTAKPVSMPPLLDVPVHYLGGGGFTHTHPIAEGDEGMVLFSSRCLDSWWQNGGEQPRPDYGDAQKNRMHSLSDGMFVPGLRSHPKILPAISTTTSQVRSDDGRSYYELLPEGKGFNAVIPGGFLKLVENGDLRVSGNVIAGYGSGDQVTLQHHTHAQDPDSDGDTEVETHPPTPGT